MNRTLARATTLVTLLFVFLSGRALCAADSSDDYNITIRASAERDDAIFGKHTPKPHGKAYAIIQFQQNKNDTPLTKPVNEMKVFRELQKNLSAYGFHEPAAGKNPDIVLTVLYGRGWLQNPYLDKTMEASGGASSGSGMSFGGAAVVSASVDQIIRERNTPGYADKVASADAEKLFIAIIAWQFPKTPKEKPVQAWRTTMLIDDPDADLNLISDRLLAAGAGYFDHSLEKEEITVASKDAFTHVVVGTPTVVEPGKSGK